MSHIFSLGILEVDWVDVCCKTKALPIVFLTSHNPPDQLLGVANGTQKVVGLGKF